jgi:hypothetical protein
LKYRRLFLSRAGRFLIPALALFIYSSTAAQDTAPPIASPIPAPVMENDAENFTNSGSIKLSWHPGYENGDDVSREFELQEAVDSTQFKFHTYYRGPDMATYISGLPGGTYHYRVREVHANGQMSDWSNEITVVVEHHSLGLAFLLFGIGGVVFLLTVGVVLKGEPGSGHRRVSPTKVIDKGSV